MLSSFFGKSRPVNLVFAGIYLLVFYLLSLDPDSFRLNFSNILSEIVVFLILLFSLFVLNFISAKNELTGRNAYKIVIFLGFACMFPETLRNNEVVLSNFFVLLALRRILSLRSQRETIQKIFDATFWIGVASLCYFWSSLFIVLVYAGIILHVGHRFRNWLVPLVAVFILFLLATIGDLLITDSFFTFHDWFQSSEFDFDAYRSANVLIPVALLLTLFLWSGFFYVLIIQKSSSNFRGSYLLILLYALLGLCVGVFASNKDSSELLFFFPSLALIAANYFQAPRDRWFREVLLLLIVLLPLVLIFLY